MPSDRAGQGTSCSIDGPSRPQQVLGGALGKSLVGSSSPNRVSLPWLQSENANMHDSMTEQQQRTIQVLAERHQEQVDGYRRAMETLILENYYQLERSIERMLQEALDRPSRSSTVQTTVVPTSADSADSADPALLPEIVAQLGKLFNAAEARAADDRWGLEKLVSERIKSLEVTFEQEMNKQGDIIEKLKRDLLVEAGPRYGHEEKATGEEDFRLLPAKSRISITDDVESQNSQRRILDHGQEKFPGIGEETLSASEVEELNVMQREKRARPKEYHRQESLDHPKKQSLIRVMSQCSAQLGKAVGFKGHHKDHATSTRTRVLFSTNTINSTNFVHRQIQKLSQNHLFVGFMESCIFLNVVIKAVQMDVDVRRAVKHEGAVRWGYYVDIGFTGIFIFELLVRLAAEHLSFFFGNHRLWNMFDTAVVACSCFEIATDGLSLGFLRIFRSLRLVRVLKIVRIFRFFRELRLMAVSIASCMVSLFWGIVLMLIVILVFAMFVLEGSKNYLRDTESANEARIGMVALYGSFPEAVYSLIQAISGGADWGVFAAPLLEVSWMYGAAFALFVSFVTLGMMNILIGIFVENANQFSQLDRDLVIQEEMSQRKSYMNQLRDLFNEMDEDNSGTVTYEEFTDCMAHERAQAYLNFLQLNAAEAQGLFMLLDLDENGEVGIEEFVLGCMRLKGAAKSIDAASMMYQTKRLAVKLNEFFEYIRERLDNLVEAQKTLSGRAPSGRLSSGRSVV